MNSYSECLFVFRGSFFESFGFASICRVEFEVGVAYSLLWSNSAALRLDQSTLEAKAPQDQDQEREAPAFCSRRKTGRRARGRGAPPRGRSVPALAYPTGPRRSRGREGGRSPHRPARRASGLACAAVRHRDPWTARGLSGRSPDRVDGSVDGHGAARPPTRPRSAHRLPTGPSPTLPAGAGRLRRHRHRFGCAPRAGAKRAGHGWPAQARAARAQPGRRRAGAVALREVRQRRLRSLRRAGFFALLNQCLRGGYPSPAVMGTSITAGDGSNDATCNKCDA
jgi:hypothetical protein